MKFCTKLTFIAVLAMLALPRFVHASDDQVPASTAQTEAAAAPEPQTTTASSGAAATTPSASQPNAPEQSRRKTAEEILAEEKKQTMLGIVPITGMTNYQYAPALTSGQKFSLMIRNYATPFPYLAAGFQAGISQAANNFEGYGQGAAGYGKRFGSALADGFDSGFFSNFFYPVLFKQDPRYFRFGSGYSKKRRMWSVVEQEFVTKKDSDRSPVFSYSNVLGALTAGSISNAYYPQEERGFGLTMSRTAVSFGWGMVGDFVLEFWPDISGRLFHKKKSDDVTVK